MLTITVISVIAAAGLRVPMHDNPSRYITDAAPVNVAHNAYYRRRMADGDLLPVANKKEKKQ